MTQDLVSYALLEADYKNSKCDGMLFYSCQFLHGHAILPDVKYAGRHSTQIMSLDFMKQKSMTISNSS